LGSIRRSFQALTALLHDESRSPAPHLCLQFAAAQQIYTAVSKIAVTSRDEGMVRDTVAFYNALIDSEEEDFLENDVFAVSLMNFVNRTVGSGPTSSSCSSASPPRSGCSPRYCPCGSRRHRPIPAASW
jgi:hypothetical protein